MPKNKQRILVVEDDPAICRGLCDVLAFNGYEPRGVEDGKQGLDEALTGQYDLALLDVMLPSMDGFSICKELRLQKPGQAIIMLTAKGAEEDVIAGFKAGADDYVAKPFSLRELMVRVEAVLRRVGKALALEPIAFKELVFDPATLKVRCKDKTSDLTRREMDIVAYLHRHKDRIVPRRELLAEVWRYGDADIETRTVDIHIQKFRKKLSELAPDSTVILTIRGEGYRLAGDGESDA